MPAESHIKRRQLGLFAHGPPVVLEVRKTMGKTMGKPWENHGKTMVKPWENHGKTMGT